MAIRTSLIIVVLIYEVISFHPHAPKPYYPRGPRPKDIPYVLEPSRLQSYANPYPYTVREAPANYPAYKNPLVQPNYQIYQPAVEPNTATYPVYQQVLEPNANYPHQQPMELTPAYPVYQTGEAVNEIQTVVPVAPVTLPTPKNDKPAGFDSNVLNNLAIALQLLIINNLINNPAPNSPGWDVVMNAIDGSKMVNKPCETEFEYPELVNAKFLGSSNFDDASSIFGYSYGSPTPSPRVGSLLKSPYDYLTSSSPEYTTSKSNLQNPYAAIFSPDGVKELFTMTDYY